MTEKIKQFIDTHNLISAQTQHVFAAVSGGVDSTVMLDILYQLRPEYNYQLHIIHFNHRTRGKANEDDEQFVEKLSKKYGIDIKIGSLDTTVLKMTETALREERYKFFARILARYKAAVIATGHNRDDNIETFLMRLAKGSRLNGLLAIKPKRNGYIRPLLNVSRVKIENYARANHISYRIDKSNEDITISRNAIRHMIIPYLKENLDTQIEQNIDRIIKDLYLYQEIFDDKLKEAVVSSVKRVKSGLSLNRKRYPYFNTAIRRGLIEYCISNNYQLNYKVSDKNFHIWENFITGAQAGKKLTFFENGTAIAERNVIIFGQLPQKSGNVYRLSVGQTIAVGDKYEISLNKISADHVLFENDRNIEYIDGGQCNEQLLVRYWQKGDRFRPLGMKNHRKLSDFFIDLKLSIRHKEEIPLVCDQDQIIWIAGYRLDDHYKITEKTEIVYKLELNEIK